MKTKQSLVYGIFTVILIAVFATAFTTCDNNIDPDPDPVDPLSVTYISMDNDGNRYTLEITENTGRSARYAAQAGDSFKFTVEKLENGSYSILISYSGTVESVQSGGTEIEIIVKVNGEQLAISVSDTGMTGISGNIVNAEGETVVETPATLTVSSDVPENRPVAERWGYHNWSDSTTVDHFSVDGGGVCKITLGGAAEIHDYPAYNNQWRVQAFYSYTAKANTAYTYVLEAWTESGARSINAQYYAASDDSIWLGRNIGLTSERQTFRIFGQQIPKGGVKEFNFQCADQLGTFYVKIISIHETTPEDLLPENWPVAERWSVRAYLPTTATHSVDSDGVCAVTIGGAAGDKWDATAYYQYTGMANTTYAYVFEAWTGPGERTIRVSQYDDNINVVWTLITLTETRTTYTVRGQTLPSSGNQFLNFSGADKLGTFYVKMLPIEPYTPTLEYELIDEYDEYGYYNENHGTYRVISATGMSGAVEIPATYLDLPVTEIGEHAFDNTTITSLTISNGVKKIHSWVFSGCGNLAGVTIPKSVTEIYGTPFNDCPNLTVFTVDADNSSYSSEGGILYNKDKTTIVAYPSASGSITIPENVTTIGMSAFFACNDLTSVTIPAGVTRIEQGAFGLSKNITSITIPETVNYIGSYAFQNWTATQTIYIKGHSDRQSTVDAGWADDWDGYTWPGNTDDRDQYEGDVVIVYQGD